MVQKDAWVSFQSFADRGAAEVLCARLVLEGVPAQIEKGSLEGTDGGFSIVVPGALVHRARWVMAQMPPTDEELEYLATGELPGDTK